MRRRQMLARPVTVDLAARELAELAGHADDLTQVEAAADGSLLAHKITQLLAVWEERSPTARAQAHCFRAYAQARLAETPLNEDELADRYNVQPGTIRVWLHRIRQRLQTQLESVEYEAAPADAQATTFDPQADRTREQRALPLPPKAMSSRDG
jgi:DNA-directed RNA polymerase specialized sigma24 family protein